MSLKVDRVQLEIEIKNDSSRKRLREVEESITDLSKGLEKLKKTDPVEYEKRSAELRKFKGEYDGLIKKIGLDNLSTNELIRRKKDLNSILRNMPRSHENYGAYAKDIEKINELLKKTKPRVKEVQDSLSKFGTSFQVFAGNMMTKGVAKIGEWYNDAKEFVKEGVKMADKSEGVVTAFNKLNAPNLLKNLRSDTKGLISDFQLMTSSVRASNFGIPLENLGKLLKFAQQRAQETGESVDYLTESIIMGIGRKSALILDNLGISAARMQAETKKTGDFASAAIKVVNEELEKQGTLALTSADKATQSSVKWENAQLKVGQRFQWLGGLWDKISGNIADGISDIAGDTRSANQVFDDQLKKVSDLNVNTLPLIDKYDQLSKKVKFTHDQTKELNPEQEELLSIIKQIQQAVPGAVSEWDKYGRAIGINTDKAREFIKIQTSLLKYMNQEAIKETEKDLKNYQSKLDALYRAQKSGTTNYTVGGSNISPGTTITRQFTDKEIIELEKDISTYESLVTGAKENLKNINGERLEERQKEFENEKRVRNQFNEMNNEQLKKWIKDEKNAKDQYLEIAKQIYSQRVGNLGGGDKTDKSAQQREKLNNALKEIETKYLEEIEVIQKKYTSGGLKTQYDYDQALLSLQNEFDTKRKDKINEMLADQTLSDKTVRIDALNQIAAIDKQNLDRQIDQANKIKKIILDADPIEAEKEAHRNRLREVGLFNDDVTKRTEEQNKVLELLEKQHAENMRKLSSREAMIALKQLEEDQSAAVKKLEERRVSEKMSDQKYKDELLKIEIDYLNKRLLIKNLSEDKIAEINKQINQATAEGISDKSQKRESILAQYGLKNLRDQKEAELKIIQEYVDLDIISKEEGLKIKAQLDQKYLESSTEKFSKVNDAIQQIGGNLTGAMTNFQSAEEDAITRKYDKQIKAAEGNSKLQQKLEAEKEKELNKVRAEYADKQFAVQAAMIVSETALAAMRAYSALAGIPVVGPALGAVAAGAAILYGASQLKVANEQRNAAKEGYQVGGYTPNDNRDDKAVGTVHANEFVANANAVRNPSVRKFLDVFDMAQKNGTIRMLNTTQILEKVRSETNNGYQTGGYTPSSTSINNVDPSILMNIIENNTNAMNRMREKLDDGIEAYSVISGDNGSYRQTQRYQTLIRNATRQKG